MSACQQVMLVKVRLSRSLKKRAVPRNKLLLASFWAIIHWVIMSDSLPWLCPSPPLGLAAGVVHLHLCEGGKRRVTGRAGLRGGGGGGEGGDERNAPPLYCTNGNRS